MIEYHQGKEDALKEFTQVSDSVAARQGTFIVFSGFKGITRGYGFN